ncbi:MAG: Ig-like domain-containing protein, partial [Pseudomonadota bacterium]
SLNFSGEAGSYRVTGVAVDENDGRSTLSLSLNGVLVSSLVLDQDIGSPVNPASFVEVDFGVVNLAAGDVLTFAGNVDAGEYARLDYVELTDVGDFDPLPSAGDDSASTDAETPVDITVLANDSDPDGTPLDPTSVTVVSGPGGGGVVIGANGVITYTPDPGFGGQDTFTYTVANTEGQVSAAASVTVDVTAPDPEPDPQSGTRIEAEDLTLNGYSQQSSSTASGGALIAASGVSTARFAHGGADGTFDLRLVYIDENDGQSSVDVQLNGMSIGGTIFDEDITSSPNNPQAYRSLFIDDVPLVNGDVITIEGTPNGGEPARIDFLEVTPSEAPVPNALAPGDFDVIVFAGQSNAERHFTVVSNDATNLGILGAEVFEREVEGTLGGDTTLIEAASGGSASNIDIQTNNYWWNNNTGNPGDAFNAAVAAIDAALAIGQDVDAIIWAQGESDARAAVSPSDIQGIADDLETATLAIFQEFRTLYGADIPIFIQEIGAFPEEGSFLGGPTGVLQPIRDAQAAVAAALDNVFVIPTSTSLTLNDSIHYTNESYGEIALNLADAVTDNLLA